MTLTDEMTLKTILETIKNKSTYSTSKFTESQFELLEQKLLKWPFENVFPVIDVLRMMLMHPGIQAFFGTYEKGVDFFTNVLRCLKPEAADPLIITTLRCMCNMYEGNSTVYAVTKMMKLVLSQFSFIANHKNKNVVNTAVSLLLK